MTTWITGAVFVAAVLVVAVAVLQGARRAGVGWGPVIVGLMAFVVIPGALSKLGLLDRYDPLPAPALLVVAALTLVTIGGMLSSIGTRLIDGIPLGWIVLLQGFRIAVEWVLHRLYLENQIPMAMTYSGRNFDILSGLSGLALGAWLIRGRPASRSLIVAWNVVGLALLANIVVIAVLATPVPFRRFTEGPPNLLPSTFPFVWLPSFLVQVALGSHILVFRWIRRSGRR